MKNFGLMSKIYSLYMKVKFFILMIIKYSQIIKINVENKCKYYIRISRTFFLLHKRVIERDTLYYILKPKDY